MYEFLPFDGVSTIFIAIVAIPVTISLAAVRFHDARRIKRALWIDDWLVVASQTWQVGYCVCALAFLEYGGLGHHIEDIRKTNPNISFAPARYLLASTILYYFGIGYPKLAITASVVRLSGRKNDQTLNAMIPAFVMLPILLQTLFIPPMALAWTTTHCAPFADLSVGRLAGTCQNGYPIHVLSCALNTYSSMSILAISMAKIHWRKLAFRRLLEVLFLICLGLAGIAVGIVRVAVFLPSGPPADATWDLVPLANVQILEPAMYHAIACWLGYERLSKPPTEEDPVETENKLKTELSVGVRCVETGPGCAEAGTLVRHVEDIRNRDPDGVIGRTATRTYHTETLRKSEEACVGSEDF